MHRRVNPPPPLLPHTTLTNKLFTPALSCLQLGSCRVLSSVEVPNYRSFLDEPNTFFYRYEYNPVPRERSRGMLLKGC